MNACQCCESQTLVNAFLPGAGAPERRLNTCDHLPEFWKSKPDFIAFGGLAIGERDR